ncbi:AraC family transcriptional regulator [Methylorubrum sp. Q1]|nr:AraC family transcriptional regulator [Methylorubrum sp. Q1]
MDRAGLTRACTMGPIVGAVETAGGSIARVFRRAEMPLALMDAPDRLILLRDQLRLVEEAVRESGDPALPARLSIATGIGGLGAIGRHVRACATLGAALARVEAITPELLQTATWTGLRQEGGDAVYGYAVAERIEVGRQANEMLALGYLLGTVRHFLGPRWRPRRAILTGATLPDRAEIERVFGCDLDLGPRAGLHFGAALLATPNPAPGPLLDTPPQPLPDGLPACVAGLVDLALCEGRPSIDWVARRLGLSRRGLQRRLEAEGTGFAHILQHVLRVRAEALLAQPTSPIGRIALDLGYADAAHFTRAFLGWTGLTPRAWRRLHLTSPGVERTGPFAGPGQSPGDKPGRCPGTPPKE